MVTVPRSITGSIGSRIRVVFGGNGNEWLLLLNHDNGDTKWQEKTWSGIPHAVAKQINNCASKGRDITAVDFGPDGAWFITGEKSDGTGRHSWWGGTSASSTIKELTKSPYNVNASFGSCLYGMETYAIIQGTNGYCLSGNLKNLEERLKRIHSRGQNINFIRLFSGGQYFVSDDEGKAWALSGEHIGNDLKAQYENVHDVAVAKDGSWLVIRAGNFTASAGVDSDLTKALLAFYSIQRGFENKRRAEIRAANDANERERRAAEEARQAAEREERERQQAREAAEREERERIQREAAQREERERVRREAEREAAAQLDAATRISTLEATLEKRLIEEAKDIKDTEEKLRNRKRSFQETMQSMSSEAQSRITIDNDALAPNDNNNSNTCVICHDANSIMAVIPCGHVCLCNNCSDVCMRGQNGQRSCPLCRGNMQSVLRIYLGGN